MSKKNLDFSAEVSALSEADNDLEAVAKRLTANRLRAVSDKLNDESPIDKHQNPKNSGEGRGDTAARVKTEPSISTDEQIHPPVTTTKSAPDQITLGDATSPLSTRVPPAFSELMDDLVYSLQKAGHKKTTKQSLVQEALTDLFRKHKLLA